jgi:hypothetical protein
MICLKKAGIILLLSTSFLFTACGDQNERNTVDPEELNENNIPDNETEE